MLTLSDVDFAHAWICVRLLISRRPLLRNETHTEGETGAVSEHTYRRTNL